MGCRLHFEGLLALNVSIFERHGQRDADVDHHGRRPGGQSGTDRAVQRPAALRESVFNPAQGLKVFRAK
jgi:hypothetical protein